MNQKTIICILIVIFLLFLIFRVNKEHFNIVGSQLNGTDKVCDKIKEYLDNSTSEKQQVGVIYSKYLKTVLPYEKDRTNCTDGNYYDFSELTLPKKHNIDNFYMIFLPHDQFNKQFNLSMYFKPKRTGKEYLMNYSSSNGEVLFSVGVNELGQLFYKQGNDEEKIFDENLNLLDDRFYFIEINASDKVTLFFENLTKELPAINVADEDCPILILGRKNNNQEERVDSFNGVIGSIRVSPAKPESEIGKYYKAEDNLLIYDTPSGITPGACKKDCEDKTKNPIYCDRLCEGCLDPTRCLWLDISDKEKQNEIDRIKNLQPPVVTAFPGDGEVSLLWTKQPNVDRYIIEVKGTYSSTDSRIVYFSASNCNGMECKHTITDLTNGEYYNFTVKAQTGSVVSEKCSEVISIAPNGIKSNHTLHNSLVETDESLIGDIKPLHADLDVCKNDKFKLRNTNLLDNYSLN